MIQVVLVGDGPHSGKLADVDEHDDVEMLTLAWNCRCGGFRWKPGNHGTTGCQELKILLFFLLPSHSSYSSSSCRSLLRPYGALSACVCVCVCATVCTVAGLVYLLKCLSFAHDTSHQQRKSKKAKKKRRKAIKSLAKRKKRKHCGQTTMPTAPRTLHTHTSTGILTLAHSGTV